MRNGKKSSHSRAMALFLAFLTRKKYKYNGLGYLFSFTKVKEKVKRMLYIEYTGVTGTKKSFKVESSENYPFC